MLCFPTSNFRCSRLYIETVYECTSSNNLMCTDYRVRLWKTERGNTVFRTMNNIKLLNGFLVFSPTVFQLTMSSYVVGPRSPLRYTALPHTVGPADFRIIIIIIFNIIQSCLFRVLLFSKYFPETVESLKNL